MKEEQYIIDKCGKKSPWKVPEGYFDSARMEILDKLPEFPAAPEPVKLSLWQRIKPYAYLAAMFAGIWCMMHIFHDISSADQLSLDNPPAQIAAYMAEPDVADMYVSPSALADIELLDEVSADYESFDEFEKDFDYQLDPKYDKIDL